MSYCKGRVIAVHQCSGCWEVVVEGEHPGAFPIDNCCIWPIVATEGADWMGRRVEYRDGCMRFLDEPRVSVRPSSPCNCSPLHSA